MLEDRINKLRETLNSEIEKNSLDSEQILTLSHDLDELITEYYKYSKDQNIK